jgi:hypothetical protein
MGPDKVGRKESGTAEPMSITIALQKTIGSNLST